MRLQHSRSAKLYSGSLQATMSETFLSGFCKTAEFVVQLDALSCILFSLRLADGRGAAAAAAGAVSFNHGWKD